MALPLPEPGSVRGLFLLKWSSFSLLSPSAAHRIVWLLAFPSNAVILYIGVRGCSGVQWDRLNWTRASCQLPALPNKQTDTHWQKLFNKMFSRPAEQYWPKSAQKTVNLKALLFRFHPASALIYSTDCTDVQVSSSSELPQRRSLIIIHIFSFLCQLRELTPPVFVQALKGAALIIRVRDGTMAFSWNCPPTRVVFDSFSWHVPRKCTQYVNECDTQTIIRLGDSDVCCETSCH